MKVSILLFCGLLSGCLWGAGSMQTDSSAGAATQKSVALDKNGVRAQAVINRWIQALGGEARLRDLRSVEVEQRMDSPSKFSGLSFHATEMFDGRFHYDLVGTATISGGFDGHQAWHASAALGFGYIHAQDFHTWIWRSELLQALRIHRDYPKIVFVEATKAVSEKYAILGMTDVNTVRENWFFDAKHGQLIKIVRFPSATAVGATTEFSDFRTVAGFVVPFHISQSNQYQSTVAERLNVTLNGSIDDSFSPPTALAQGTATIDLILNHYIAAIGGETALHHVHSRVTNGTVETFPLAIATRVTLSQKDPNLILREEESPGLGKTATGFDGAIGWVNSEIQGFRRLKDSELQQWRAHSELEGELDVPALYPLRKYMGGRTIDGRRVQAIAMATSDGPAGTFYFDEANGFLVRVETEVNLNPKTRVPATADFGDFRPVNGLSVPFKTTWTTPTSKMVMSYDSIVFNAPLPDSLFKERRDD